MTSIVELFGRHREPVEELPPVGTLPSVVRSAARRNSQPDEFAEIGKVVEDARRDGRLAAAPEARQDNMAKIAELIDAEIAVCAEDLRRVGSEVAKAFEILATIAVSEATTSRSMVESAGIEAKKVMAECTDAAEHLRSTGAQMRGRHEDFVHSIRAARAAVLNARTSFGPHGAVKRDDQEVAVEMARELLQKIERVAPTAALAANLRALLEPPAQAETDGGKDGRDQAAAVATDE